MNDAHPRSHLFTLRLWPGSRSGGGSGWRGKVTHVLSGETRYFQDWPQFISFVAELGGLDGAPPSPLIADDEATGGDAQ